jgi:hypothetical protein
VTHKIAVLAGGWVLVGVVEHEDDAELVFSSAAVIRRWGTTMGIGQLAKGPLRETVVDPISTRTRCPKASVIFDIEVTGWDAVIR